MTPAEPIAVAARPRGRTLLIALATLALSIPLPACSLAGLTAQTAKPAAPARQFYALWITRWDTRSERDVVRAIANAHALGVTDVFWQVRGTFDAFYKSDLEPWGEWLTQSLPEGEREPPFDPLAVAIREAHARNIRIHAWVNATPLWRGKDPPKDPRHPINAHPEWRLRDARGNPDPLRDGYVIANPVLENVHDHIARVCADIARRYDIDGLHLDYIRFDPAVTDRPLTYPRDAATISQFERTQGPHNLDTPAGQAEYRAWIRDRITALVRRVGTAAREARPSIELSAAVWRHPEIARETYLQDGARWLNDGLIDRALPMIYTDLESQLTQDWAAWKAAAPASRLSVGLGVYKHQAGETAEQFGLLAGSDGFALFGYSSLFESTDPFQDRSPKEQSLRESRRRSLATLIERLKANAALAPPGR